MMNLHALLLQITPFGQFRGTSLLAAHDRHSLNQRDSAGAIDVQDHANFRARWDWFHVPGAPQWQASGNTLNRDIPDP